MAQTNNAVKFIYVAKNGTLPENRDGDTIYFDAKDEQLYVGNDLIANASDAGIDVVVSGEGDYIANATFSDNVLTLTKSSIASAVNAAGFASTGYVEDATSSVKVWVDSQTFATQEYVNSAISNAGFASEGYVDNAVDGLASEGYVNDQISVVTEYVESAYATTSYVTSAIAAAVDGLASEGYVDDAIAGLSGAMKFIGISTTAITDGGTQTPTISGETVTPESGDVVIYNGLEFVWDGSKWNQFGDESSYALKTIQVSAGDGLTGGGNLTSDVVFSHGSTGTGTSTDYMFSMDPSGTKFNNFEVLSKISIDEFGHITSVEIQDISYDLYSVTTDCADAAISAALDGGAITSAISSATSNLLSTGDVAQTVDSGDANPVAGDAVYNAIEAAGFLSADNIVTPGDTYDYLTGVYYDSVNGIYTFYSGTFGSVASNSVDPVTGSAVYDAISNAGFASIGYVDAATSSAISGLASEGYVDTAISSAIATWTVM